jgi:hypothetical protein
MDFDDSSANVHSSEWQTGWCQNSGHSSPKNGSPNARELQKILTLYGCSIRTRLGVNETHFGEPAGLIILELKGVEAEMDRLEADLRACNSCIVRRMTFGG